MFGRLAMSHNTAYIMSRNTAIDYILWRSEPCYLTLLDIFLQQPGLFFGVSFHINI